MQMKIVSGNRTILLTGAGVRLYDYAPAPTTAADKKTVSEKLRLRGVGASSAFIDMVSELNSIAHQVNHASQFETVEKSYVYITMAEVVTPSSWYRAELKSLSVAFPNSLFVEDSASGSLVVNLSWVRNNGWESTVLQQATLLNRNGANTTIKVFNNYDTRAGRDNFLTIAPVLEGDMPAQPIVTIKNTYNSAADLYKVRMGLLPYAPSNFTGVVEAESGTAATGAVTGAGYSGSAFRTYTALANNPYQLIDSYPLTTVFLNDTMGSFYKILAHFPYLVSSALWYKFVLKIDGATLWEGEWNKPSYGVYIVDGQTVQLPPRLNNMQSGVYPLKLDLYTRNPTNSDVTFGLDFVQFMPVAQYRTLYSYAFGLNYNQTLFDNHQTGNVYITEGGLKAPTFLAEGSPFLLQPNTAQKLFFCMEGPADAYPDRTIDVSISYYPKYTTLPKVT